MITSLFNILVISPGDVVEDRLHELCRIMSVHDGEHGTSPSIVPENVPPIVNDGDADGCVTCLGEARKTYGRFYHIADNHPRGYKASPLFTGNFVVSVYDEKKTFP